MSGKIYLVHHGGHRGGYGVCWDLRAVTKVHSHALGGCNDYPAEQFGIITPEQFKALQPTAASNWHGEVTLHCSTKEAALKEAERLGLEVINQSGISKQLKQTKAD